MGINNNYKLGAKDIFSKGLRLLKKPSPEQVLWLNFAVTYLCNSRCGMCNIWKKYKENPDLSDQELTLPEIESLIGSRYLRNLQWISFTGGEPFLRKDFVELAGLFVQRYPGAFIGIATNGLSPELIAGKTVEIVKRYNPRLLSLSLSLDGIGQKHDEMRGVVGAYESVMQTVRLLQSEVDVNLGFDFTITPDNYKDLLQVSEVSRKLGIKLLAGFAHNSQSYYGNEGKSFAWQTGELTEVSLLLEQLVKNKIKDEPLLSRLFDPYAYYIKKAAGYEVNKRRMFRCHSGTHSFFLDPQGNVYPCIINTEKMGNVKEQNFDTLWLSSEAHEARSKICSDKCHCWVACDVVPSLFRSLNIVEWNAIHKFFL